MQNASVLAACMTLTRSDFVENKVMKTCFLAFLLMPSARESVQSDRFFPDLKRSSSPLVGPSLSGSTQGSHHSHPLSACLHCRWRLQREGGFYCKYRDAT